MITVAYQKPAVYLLIGASALAMPDVVFGLLLELAHLLVEALHLLFELFEAALDHLVEHLFHTDTRQTQIIVFYLMVGMGLVASYFLWRALKRWLYGFKQSLHAAVLRYNNIFWDYWAQSAHNKFKLIAGVNASLTFVYIFCF